MSEFGMCELIIAIFLFQCVACSTEGSLSVKVGSVLMTVGWCDCILKHTREETGDTRSAAMQEFLFICLIGVYLQ